MSRKGKVVSTPSQIGEPGPGGIAIDPEGERIAVIRPDKAELALAIAAVALKKNDGELLDHLPDLVGGYTFAGWLSAEGHPQFIVDDQGRFVRRETERVLLRPCLTTSR
jgi:hypothetical protein